MFSQYSAACCDVTYTHTHTYAYTNTYTCLSMLAVACPQYIIHSMDLKFG